MRKMKTVVKFLPQKNLPFSVYQFQVSSRYTSHSYKLQSYKITASKQQKFLFSNYRKNFISSSYMHVFASIYAKVLTVVVLKQICIAFHCNEVPTTKFLYCLQSFFAMQRLKNIFQLLLIKNFVPQNCKELSSFLLGSLVIRYINQDRPLEAEKMNWAVQRSALLFLFERMRM